MVKDFILAPANLSDVTVGEELLSTHTDLDVFGDKAFISASLRDALRQDNRIRLHTLPRTNQKHQLPPELYQFHNHVRQIVETVTGQEEVS